MNLMNFKIEPRRKRIGFFAGFFLIATFAATAAPDSIVVGNVRVQLLSGSLVRLEFAARRVLKIEIRSTCWIGTGQESNSPPMQ